MDPVDLADIVRSLRRSRGRTLALLALVELDAASAPEIAIVAGLDRRHILGIMIGEMPGFVPARSLVAMGLASPRMTRHGVVYAATEKARVVAAALSRRAVPRVHLNIASTRSL